MNENICVECGSDIDPLVSQNIITLEHNQKVCGECSKKRKFKKYRKEP